MASRKDQGIRRRAERARAREELDKRVVTGMANSLRTQVLVILNERAGSATELSKELGTPYDKVSYEMSALKRAELIELVAERRVRGATELFYRATRQAYIGRSEWPGVPNVAKGGLRGSLLETLTDDAVAAIFEGTYDSLEEAHMIWMPMLVDEQGWEDGAGILRRAFEELVKVKEDSAVRLIAKDAKGISCTFSMLGYPSASEDRKIGPPTDAKQVTK